MHIPSWTGVIEAVWVASDAMWLCHVVCLMLAVLPCRYRADIFRFCALYADGGVYLDADLELMVPLDDTHSPCSHVTIGHDYPQVSRRERERGRTMHSRVATYMHDECVHSSILMVNRACIGKYVCVCVCVCVCVYVCVYVCVCVCCSRVKPKHASLVCR